MKKKTANFNLGKNPNFRSGFWIRIQQKPDSKQTLDKENRIRIHPSEKTGSESVAFYFFYIKATIIAILILYYHLDQ